MTTIHKRKPAGGKRGEPVESAPSGGAAAPPQSASAGSTPGAAPAPARAAVPGAREQADTFERAVREFHARNFASAQNLFELAASGPNREMAHAARLHARMCARRTARPDLSLKTPDEHYDYAVALINQRRLEQAEKHLLHAIAQSPRGDHLYYALALCRGLAGDLEGAYLNLRHAIELNPRNRVAARNDPDFSDLGQLAPLRGLLYPERASSS